MRTGFLLLLSVLLNLPLWAHKGKMQVSHKNVAPIVVVSSYNPDVKSISDNISAFYEQYTKSGLPTPLRWRTSTPRTCPTASGGEFV
ncbi:hypothetical protein DW060_02715 [Leyella stercorea]|uniref:Uncharacterized protein n=1 Tax=Leyella stercorea TaxID=363265 RepID=A0A3R6I3E5_9BACT|nr:hypothetical protein DW060_02715 [Leyella stercorea]